IERLLAVMNVSAAETVALLEVERRDHLTRNDQVADPWRVLFQLSDRVCGKLFSTCGPITLLQFVRRELHVNRHHMFARWRQCRIAERGDVDVEIRLRGELAVLRRIESALEIIDLRTNVNAARKFYCWIVAIQTTKSRQICEREVDLC